MHHYLIFTCFALLTLTGCSNSVNYTDDRMFGSSENDVPRAPYVDLPPPVLSIHGQEVTNIIQEVSVDFKHDRHLHLCDAHTYYNAEGIHTIQLKYESQDLLDPCEARYLIVDLVEALLDKLNDNMYLIPEFPNFAFYPINFEIYINMTSFFSRYVDPYYIKWICMEDGIISFYAADMYDNNKNCWHARRESFYTSRNITIAERQAEAAYKSKHDKSLQKVFGDKIYIPKEDDN